MIIRLHSSPNYWRGCQSFWFTICNSKGREVLRSRTYQSKQAAQKMISSLKKNGLKFKLNDTTQL